MASRAQQSAEYGSNRPREIRCDNIVPAEMLLKHCPLTLSTFAKPNVEPDSSLGTLDKLPTEVQHSVFCHLDLQSFLTCRCLSRKALTVTGSVLEHEKIMRYETDTARYFTIAELFQKLCQRTCDGPDCDRVAPYLNLVHLERQCIGCRNSVVSATLPSLSVGTVRSFVGFSEAQLASLPSFLFIPVTFAETGNVRRGRFIDAKAFYQVTKPGQTIRMNPGSMYTSVVATILDKKSKGNFRVVRCPYRTKGICGYFWSLVHSNRRDDWPCTIYMFEDEYKAHMKDGHGIDCMIDGVGLDSESAANSG